MSVRVVRWDTGREHEIPEEALRWGPDTKQGTCRAQLLRGPWFRDAGLLPGDVPYVLPFNEARWAVRVAVVELRHGGSAVCPDCSRPLALHGIGCPSLSVGGRARLGSLLEAAADALRAEAEEDRPDALGEAMELLAACLPLVEELRKRVGDEVARRRMAALLHVGYRLLERETSAEIRREWRGAGRG